MSHHLPGSVRRNKLRNKLRIRQQDLCHYCGIKMWFPRSMARKEFAELYNVLNRQELLDRRGTFEHLIRRVEGGGNSQNNLVLACHKCNSERGDVPHEQWKEIQNGKHPQNNQG